MHEDRSAGRPPALRCVHSRAHTVRVRRCRPPPSPKTPYRGITSTFAPPYDAVCGAVAAHSFASGPAFPRGPAEVSAPPLEVRSATTRGHDRARRRVHDDRTRG
ncbi:hypothetical protein GCM10010250_10400 [Streptomyces althioticus]|nr:hypothetical protein GCM10010250_10400 [Streptomyces althioticus]GGT35116.1 hypothetical protein GCM10010243_09650 [Streptomyces matensis]